MLFIVLFSCIILLILFEVSDRLFEFEITNNLTVFFMVCFAILSMVTLLTIIIAGYDSKINFPARDQMLLIQWKMLKEKKESNILQKEIEDIDQLGAAASSYLSETIQEIKELEKEILKEKWQLQKDIIVHNRLCNSLIFGLFSVDEKEFDIYYEHEKIKK